MKRSMAWIGEIVIGAGIAAAATLLLAAGAPRSLPSPPPAAEPGATDPVPAAEPAIERVSATPVQVAALFGWKPPVTSRPSTAPRAVPSKPVPVRLKLVGFVENDEGTVQWIFKDTRDGTVISLAPGATSRGWTLVEVQDREFRLDFEGATYAVPRGE